MKTALLFPGQGSQYVGMGRNLYDRYNIARRTFEEASDCLGSSVSRLCFDGSHEELTRTDVAQPCILTVSIAAYRVLCEHTELDPAYYAGHSLGEFSALAASGALEFGDAVSLVAARGRFMHECQLQGAGGMIAVHGLDFSDLEEECARLRGKVAVSNLNPAGQTVISGELSSLASLKERLSALGARVVQLQVGAAFHSPMMQEASVRFKERLSPISFRTPRASVLSNVTARPYPDIRSMRILLAEQMVSIVNWRGCMQFLFERETRRMIEVGPGSILTNMLRRERNPEFSCHMAACDDESDWKTLLGEGKRPVASVDYEAMLKAALCEKNTNVDMDSSLYMDRIAAPYGELKRLSQLAREGAELPSDARDRAFRALDQVLEAKLAPEVRRKEIKSRLELQGGIQLHVQHA